MRAQSRLLHRMLLFACCIACCSLSAAKQPAQGVQQLAAQLYPGHALVQLQPTRTSIVQEALQRARSAGSGSGSGSAVLVVLQPASKQQALVVDRPLVLQAGQQLVLATPAALQAAADVSSTGHASHTRSPDLLAVQCRSSKTGFINASAGAASLEMLGLSIAGCPATAVIATKVERVLLQDVELLGNNHKAQLDEGGALLAEDVGQLRLQRVRCAGNFVLLAGGCIKTLRVRELTLADSRFTGNVRHEPDSPGGGGAVAAEFTDVLQLSNCSFSGNTALGDNNKGGAVLARLSGDVSVTGSSFSNNSASGEGGALFAGDVRSVNVSGCSFVDNGPLPALAGDDEGLGAINGGGIAVIGMKDTAANAVRLSVQDCTFEGNAADCGAGLYVNQYGVVPGRVTVLRSHFEGHESLTGAGIMLEQSSLMNVTISGCSFANNSASDGGGGAVKAFDSDAIVADCSFTGNTAADDGGAMLFETGIASGKGNTAHLSNCTFTDNSAVGSGGALAASGQVLHAEGLLLARNKAVSRGGAMHLQAVPSARLTDVQLTDNSAEDIGGGLHMSQVASATLAGVVLQRNQAVSGGGMHLTAVLDAVMANTSFVANEASSIGGAVTAAGSRLVVLRNSSIVGNAAMLAGGLAADSSAMVLEDVQFHDNVAGSPSAISTSGVLPPMEFASLVHIGGSAGAGLLQRSSLQLERCVLSNNTAAHAGGALLVQQPQTVEMRGCRFAHNSAAGAAGGALVLRAAGKQPPAALLTKCEFAANTASDSGGAVLLDSGLGPQVLRCEGCTWSSNTAGKHGGGVAGSGDTSFECVDCTADGNRAGSAGGWLACSGCSSVSLRSGSSSNNTASGAGGAVMCDGCSSFTATNASYSNNTALAGGAVAAQASVNVTLSHCSVSSNQAAVAERSESAQPGSADMRRQESAQLPAEWQALLADGPAGQAASGDCHVGGAGGGVCIGAAAHADLADNVLSDNKAATGGGLFASAACSHSSEAPPAAQQQQGDSIAGSCGIRMANLSASGNWAAAAGGGWFTSTPDTVHLEPGSSTVQLQQNNSVAAGGYGAGAASAATNLSLLYAGAAGDGAPMWPAATSASQSVLPQQQQQQQQQQNGRKLRMVVDTDGSPVSPKVLLEDILRGSPIWRHREEQAAAAAIDDALEPVCPPLGATLLATDSMAVDSYTMFLVPLYLLDAFGSLVTRGPSSSWLATLQPQGSSVQLSGATRARLGAGSVVFDGLTVDVPPGSNLTMLMRVMDAVDTSVQPLSANITVDVRPCLAGQQASISGQQRVLCQMCAAPLFSFTAYANGNSSSSVGNSSRNACQMCPRGGVCAAGMLIPAQGWYQPHPRSSVMRKCPHVAACTRELAAVFELQGMQCANRRFISPGDIDPRPFTLLQCSAGYTGALCSSCWRPGRNTWLREQLLRELQYGRQQPGYMAADQGVLARPPPGLDASAAYGRRSGRCVRCPHIALAWLRFLLARCVDMAFVATLALLWLLLGWLSESPGASMLTALKRRHRRRLRFGSRLDWASAASALGLAPVRTKSMPAAQSQHGQGKLSQQMSMAAQPDCVPSKQQDGKALNSEVTVVRCAAHTESPRSSTSTSTSEQGSSSKAGAQHGGAPSEDGPFAAQHNYARLDSAAISTFAPASTVKGTDHALAVSAFASAALTALDDTPSARAPSLRQALSSRLGSILSKGSGWLSRAHSERSDQGGSREFYHLHSPVSLAWTTAVDLMATLQQQQRDADNTEAHTKLALLLLAVKELACMAQVVLDCGQVAALVLAQDLTWLLPGWAVTGMSAALVTQSNTWQWVPFDCLLPVSSPSSGAAVQSLLIMVLPVLYVAVLLPLIMAVRSMLPGADCSRLQTTGSGDDAVPAATRDQHAAGKDGGKDARRARDASGGIVRLLVALCVASMAYCYVLYGTEVVGALSCMSFAQRPLLPGEVGLPSTRWVRDMQLQCWRGAHLGVALVALLVGVPLLLGYWLLLLVLACPAADAAADAPAEAPAPAGQERQQAADTPAVTPASPARRRGAQLLAAGRRLLWPLVRRLQPRMAAARVSASACAGMPVWNARWCWAWLPVRELLKLCVLLPVALLALRAPPVQALVTLLLVVADAALAWAVRPGCGTSMERLLYTGHMWMQALALLVLLLALPGLHTGAVGGVLLGLVALLALQAAALLARLAWHCVVALRNLGMPTAVEV